jgi:hypothetical protein
MDKINWDELSENPNAIHLLEQNRDKISWWNKIDWIMLSSNPNAIHLLEQNVYKIDWEMLSENPSAIHLLEQKVDKIDWQWLSANPNAIHLLEKNIDKIHWDQLSSNPNAIHLLAPLNYEHMRIENKEFFQELVQFVCHPTWQMKCASRLHMDLDEYQYLLMECNVF